jgi:hypothetical protein
VKLLILLVLACATAFGNACQDAAAGVWSSAASWSSCGSTHPGDGDTVLIENGHTITLDSNVGTTGGGGIGQISIESSNGSGLVVDGLGQHTITTSAALAIRVFNQGTLDFSAGTGANYTKIQGATTSTTFGALYTGSSSVSGNTLNINFSHVVIGQGVCEAFSDGCLTISAGGTCTACVTINVSDVVFQATGYGSGKGLVYTGNTGGTAYVANSPSFSGLAIVGRPALPMLYTAANPCTAWSFNYSSDFEPVATTAFIGGNVAPCGMTATGNMGYQALSPAFAAPFAQNQTGGTTTASPSFAYNLWRIDPSQSTSITAALMFQVTCGSYGSTVPCSYTNNMAVNAASAADGPGGTDTWTGNWFRSNSNTSTAQGQFIANSGTHTLTGNMLSWSSQGNGNTWGYFCYTSTTISCTGSRNTAIFPASIAFNNYALIVGDQGIDPVTSAFWHNNLFVNPGVGIADYGGTGNTWGTGGTGGVGSSNNDVYNANAAYYTDGMSTHFTNGTNAHPNLSIYGDLAVNPAMISPNRDLAAADLFLGGPGTELHLLEQLMSTQTPLIATLNIAGGLTANPAYTPQGVYNFISAGFSPTNNAATITTAAQDGSYVGARKPLCIGCWIP